MAEVEAKARQGGEASSIETTSSEPREMSGAQAAALSRAVDDLIDLYVSRPHAAEKLAKELDAIGHLPIIALADAIEAAAASA